MNRYHTWGSGPRGPAAHGPRPWAPPDARPSPLHGRGTAGGALAAEASAPRRQRALPPALPPLPHSPNGRARPTPTRPRAAPRCLTVPIGAVERGGGRHLLISPAAGIYLAGEPALPGPAPTSTALPAAAGDKGEGPLSGALAPHPPPGQAAAFTPLQLPQSLALEAAILAPAARPPSRRSRRQAQGRHGTRTWLIEDNRKIFKETRGRCQNTDYMGGLLGIGPTLLDQSLFYSLLFQRCIRTTLTICQQFKAHIKFLCILTYFI
ncbi:uncharacterized protein [Ciconia boyciana]|uniref:uncharacterized protein n=1 Tax=Ciconia boyciana TaxID=52775 RepID=UPI003B9EB419